MKRILWIILLIVLIAVLTKPGFEKHKQKIKDEFKGKNPVLGTLGGGKVYSELVDYHNIYVFSYTTIQDKTVSFGVFSMVFVSKDLDLIKKETKK